MNACNSYSHLYLFLSHLSSTRVSIPSAMKLEFVLTNLILLLAYFPCIRCDLDSDRNALLEFANSVRHVRKLNWNASDPICSSWIGISCSKDKGSVIGVHLPGIGLYGSIPSNSIGKLNGLRVLSLRSNYLNGELPFDVLSIPSLKALYLQHNNFSGSIPLSLSPRLTVLDLSFNSLSGDIPSSVVNLNRLSVLNLQFNFISGSIAYLGDVPSLVLLNLSHNLVNGSIPKSLAKFPVSSFVGNARLCGAPLTASCSILSPSASPLPAPVRQKSRKLNKGSISGIAIGGAALICLVFAYVLWCVKKKDVGGSSTRVIKVKSSDGGKIENLKSEDFGSGVQGAEKIKLVVFEGCCSFNFDLEDLLRASAEVLGKGTYGTTYKAILDETTTVAVKRLKEIGVIGKKEFDQYMELVSKLGPHPNLVPLLAYYCSKDEKLLVYEYMPATSLAAALHGNRGNGGSPLDWDTRLNITLGAARGIAHIHLEGGAKFVHGNIKSSNILLRGGLDGCVSDFGLSPLTNHTEVKHRLAGYRAPEVIESPKASQKCDVYSFGVLILEILTGKSPIRYAGHEEVVDLPRWVKSVVREEWTAEVFDVELIKHNNVEEELVQMLQIAFCCVAKVPEMRPTMEEVVAMIERIRHPEMDNRPSSEDVMSKDSNLHTP